MRRNKKSSGYRTLILFLILVGLAAWYAPLPGDLRRAEEQETDATTGALPTPRKSGGPKRAVTLVTPDKNSESLTLHEVAIDGSQPIEEQLHKTLRLLFSGEASPAAVFPEGMTIRELFMYDDTAVVSLDGAFRRTHNSGLWTELLALYSVVNTLTESFEEIGRVQILIDNKEADVFIHHVSISGTLVPDTSLYKNNGDQPDRSGEPKE